ncbi:MAG: tyrosine-type recombinase/integrase, partial [Planctomycetes bacterium]|nr:tyrosine-type recombinase/integrase [Planctomycetota bacterium]
MTKQHKINDQDRLYVCFVDGCYELHDAQNGPIDQVNKFLSTHSMRGLSPQTIRAYAYDSLNLFRWLKATGKQLTELIQADLIDYIRAQREKGAHPNSINHRLAVCGFLYEFWTGHEIQPGNGTTVSTSYYKGRGRDRKLGIQKINSPPRRGLRVKAPRRLVEPLTEEQVRVFLRSLRRYRDVAIVYLMLLCGLRSSEVLSLKRQDVSFEEKRLRVRGKGNKERLLPLPGIILQTIDNYLFFERPRMSLSTALFVVLQGNNRGQPMTPAGLRSLFRHRRLNRIISSANAHRFRHTFGADMARSGVRLPLLQKMMGHADSATTLQYINLSMTDLAKEYHRAIVEIQKR